MTTTRYVSQHPTKFKRFCFAFVGQDQPDLIHLVGLSDSTIPLLAIHFSFLLLLVSWQSQYWATSTWAEKNYRSFLRWNPWKVEKMFPLFLELAHKFHTKTPLGSPYFWNSRGTWLFHRISGIRWVEVLWQVVFPDPSFRTKFQFLPSPCLNFITHLELLWHLS